MKGKRVVGYNSFPYGIYALLLVIVGVFLLFTNGSVSPGHLLNIARAAAPLGIAAIGQTLVLLVGGLDLSLGASISMTNLVLASVMNGSMEKAPQAIIFSFALCGVIGLLNGLVITKFKMQPFLATMAMALIVQGGYYIYTQGIGKGSVAPEIRVLSESWVGGIPLAVIIWLSCWFLLSFILRKSTYGQKLYLTGANPRAARLSGFHSDAIIISAYVSAQLLACTAGIMLSAYIGVASIDIGLSYNLGSIAASVIGGVAFTGGIGTLEGTFPGVMIITILSSLMTIIGISEAGKLICQGFIIAIMVSINQINIEKS